MAEKPIGPGTVLAGRYRLEDLLSETAGAKFWRATDQTLARNVAVNVLDVSDRRAEALLVAARTSATVTDGHFLRVLDAAEESGVVYIVNEWGSGVSLDRMLDEGPLPARRAAWLVKEVAEAVTTAHRQGIAHGRLIPENVMVTEAGSVKLIGFVVDAVLNGRPADESQSEHETDVLNLGSLLYAALTGRWPGTAGCRLPEAPRDHGHPLRPRQVRAGVPRPLDAICDRVLNPEGHHQSPPVETAHEIAAALSDYIGDPTGAAQLGYEPTTALSPEDLAAVTGAIAAAEEPGAHRADSAEPADSADSVATQVGGGPDAPAHRASADPEATQAGAPVFFDDHEPGWASPGERPAPREDDPEATRVSAPPPPPLPPAPEPRPLFADDMPGSRYPDDVPGSRYSADTGSVAPPRGLHPTGGQRSGSSHGTGSLPAVWGPDAGAPEEPDSSTAVDGSRNWLRLAAMVGAVLLLVLALVFAFNLGRGSDPGGTGSAGESPSGSASDGSAAKPLSIAAVSDFDPEGSPPEENPELAPLAIDGKPSTAWRTMTYYNNPHLGLLKDGVGLVVDLGKVVDVSSMQVTLDGSPNDLSILAAGQGDAKPTSTTGLTKVASKSGVGGKVDLPFGKTVTTRYLVVWLTSLPPAAGGYQGAVAEISVRS